MKRYGQLLLLAMFSGAALIAESKSLNAIDRAVPEGYNRHQSRKGVPLGSHVLNRGGKGGQSRLKA